MESELLIMLLRLILSAQAQKVKAEPVDGSHREPKLFERGALPQRAACLLSRRTTIAG